MENREYTWFDLKLHWLILVDREVEENDKIPNDVIFSSNKTPVERKTKKKKIRVNSKVFK